MTADCFASCAPGLEPLLVEELAELSIAGEAVKGGVEWKGSTSSVAIANLWSRLASRVVIRVGSFRARTFFELERHANKIEWDRYVQPAGAVRFRVTCRKSRLYHSDAVAQRFQESVARKIGNVTVGTAAEDDADDAATGQLFVVRFERDVCTVSVDTSGALLHRRGYRQAIAKAPLRETLAAAMLRGAGWNGRVPLVDPMCGSGTIAIEAAMIARRIPPGLTRDFAFLHWADADVARWSELLAHARGQVANGSPVRIAASDRDAGAIEAARTNAERAGVAGDVELTVQPLSAAQPVGKGAGAVLVNPPYGERIGKSDELRDLYAQLGNVMRGNFAGWTLGLLSADRALDAQLRLELTERFATSNGGIPVRFLASQTTAA